MKRDRFSRFHPRVEPCGQLLLFRRVGFAQFGATRSITVVVDELRQARISSSPATSGTFPIGPNPRGERR